MSSSRLIFKNGRLVTEEGEYPSDLAVENGKIVDVSESIEPSPDDCVVDAADLYILPGLIDPHLHIQLDTGIYKTPDDWKVGTESAALGGITTVIDFATQFPGLNYTSALEARLNEIEGRAVVDYGLHMMITDQHAAGKMSTLKELGVGSVKVYTTYRPNYFQDDAQLLSIMKEAAENDLLVLVHAENDAMVTSATEAFVKDGKTSLANHGRARPEFAEVEAARRVLFLAREAGCRIYIVHNSSPRTVDEVVLAQEEGLKAYSETCPQYLTLDDSLYESEEAYKYILQPPLRSAESRDLLWQRVLEGEVDTIGTDHCDYSLKQKKEHTDFRRVPGGLPGLQTSFALMYQNGVVERDMTLSDLVRLMSANPARIFGLWPRKGVLEPGSDADFVLFDPESSWTIRASEMIGTAGYSPWEGTELTGRIRAVYSRGEKIVENGEVMAKAGRGLRVR